MTSVLVIDDDPTLRALALRAVVAAPIAVEGKLWGAMITLTTRDESLPPVRRLPTVPHGG
jgi:hypothetical protein